MFQWKERILAMNEAAKIHKANGITLEKACDYVLSFDRDEKYCTNVEWMSKQEFEKFVKDSEEFV